MLQLTSTYRSALFRGAAVAALVLGFASSGEAQFFASQTDTGETIVVDGGGQAITIVSGEPVGSRPADCPSDAYYPVEAPSDSSVLVLKDCATDQAYTVQMR